MSSSSVLYSINNKKHEDVESYEIHQLLEDKEVVQMSAGHDFCLFVLSNGEVYGVGSNRENQLGNADTETKRFILPQKIDINEFVIQVQCAGMYGCMLTRDNKLYTGGNNNYGQLGRKLEEDSATYDVAPFPVPIAPIKAFGMGYDHTLVWTADSKLFACGDNAYCQLGLPNIGHETKYRELVSVPICKELQSQTVIQISGGAYHTLMLTQSGQVWSAGKNVNVEYDDEDNSQPSSHSFSRVIGIGPVSMLVAGYNWSVFVTRDDEMFVCGKLDAVYDLGEKGAQEFVSMLKIDRWCKREISSLCGYFSPKFTTRKGELYSKIEINDSKIKNYTDSMDVRVADAYNCTYVLLTSKITRDLSLFYNRMKPGNLQDIFSDVVVK